MNEKINITRLQLEKYCLGTLDEPEKSMMEAALKTNKQLGLQLDDMRQQSEVFKTRYQTFQQLKESQASRKFKQEEEEDSILLIDSENGKLALISAIVIILIAVIGMIFTIDTNSSIKNKTETPVSVGAQNFVPLTAVNRVEI